MSRTFKKNNYKEIQLEFISRKMRVFDLLKLEYKKLQPESSNVAWQMIMKKKLLNLKEI